MDIQIDWRRIMHGSDPKWYHRRCLYIYVDSRDKEILYVGKAGCCSVRERWTAGDKRPWRAWAFAQGVEHVHLHVGQTTWGVQSRYSPAKLADVESLLINEIEPAGNIMATRTRIRRPGLRASCFGNWPHNRSIFLDV